MAAPVRGEARTTIRRMVFDHAAAIFSNIPVTRFIAKVTNNPLLQGMIENSQEERDKHSRSWTPRFVSLAFVFYVASPKSYRIQKKIFTMPSVSTCKNQGQRP
jgi:hypothetical protein